MEETQVIEIDDLKERCSGRTRTMIRVLDSFVGISGGFREKLQAAEVNNDLIMMAKTLHTIKGLLREIAAIEGAKAMEGLENKLRDQNVLSSEDLTSVQSWIDTASQAAEEVKERLNREENPG